MIFDIYFVCVQSNFSNIQQDQQDDSTEVLLARSQQVLFEVCKYNLQNLDTLVI